MEHRKILAGTGLGVGAALAAALTLLPSVDVGGYSEPLYRRPPRVRPKSTHKRKFKGSKAAKKASRR